MTAAYRNGGPWLDSVIDYLQGNIELVRTALATIPNVELIEPQGTFLLWLDFRKTGLAPKDLTAFLREKAGWALTRGEAFGAEGEGFARLNIACPADTLKEALEKFTKAFD